MYRYIGGLLMALMFLCTGCPEEMVGAPCVPETDKGEFNIDVEGVTWSLETGSVQCATRICLTQIRPNQTASKGDCEERNNLDACWKGNNGPVQLKFSFCSCRCMDAEGHKYKDNTDKYDDLCECPPSTVCEKVMEPIDGGPPNLPGGYCVPSCIHTPCSPDPNTGEPRICTPSKNSDEPWKWYCAEVLDPVESN